MKRMLRNTLVAAMLLPAAAMAAERNDMASCYDASKLSEFKPAPSGRQLVIVVDQTIRMPEDIQRSAWEKIDRFVQEGDQVKLYTFSAFVPGEYMRLQADVTLEVQASEAVRNEMGMSKLRQLDTCMKAQKAGFVRGVGGLFVKAMRDANNDNPKSEILHALREVGTDMSQQPARDRVVFLISDMLENSDYASFYANSAIQNLNVAQQIQKASDKALFADLGGARVYVAGAGLVTDSIKQKYRSGKTMDLLNEFWSAYFDKSRATLESFGAPMLNVDLK
ncbi:hypothetical protein PS918_01092 [Pseudomonas fluorescens]|uniref:VWFA domain-containing protein n=1 Tax=Pseudomonas fluorescens TaxID=294 RepID=A0A5E7R9Y3_PSEFL|nr:hypothetical protein [Pseudomonas fluorescens]VVP70919.1 hypothetical protein PS918_01092 [Pseudomonas fluorescens]